ncbi:gluconeogenesis factor YvcK family protein [Alkaliphilus transvaalensis]|uniref:gluconeogenesis factor YvcK family protein n=1 Tax=Alkaliphilus transvaalensis TaxID=114628 RepID=UPI000478A997|nr:gluconeogenesis factor YvcK family protein [Alkaliphilus transvaalensis]
MKIEDWLKPGLQIKRWLLIGIAGIVLLLISLSYYINLLRLSLHGWSSLLAGVMGVLLVIYALYRGVGSLLTVCHFQNSLQGKLDRTKINKMFYDKRILNKGPKIVVIGGGTGLSVLLRGIKLYTSNITAIVTVADDGGGSGKLREDLGMLPPGDIRNCILALAEMEPTMEQLLQYRFPEGSLKGQSFGNLLIASMNGISNNFEEAIKKISEVLAVTGNVLPVTLENMTLYAKLENGTIVEGESNIPQKSIEENSPIKKISINPKHPKAVIEALEAIQQADVVVLGPGSLYTSIIPNLLINDIRKSLLETTAEKVYIPNIMTQPGETTNYSVLNHLEAIFNHFPELSIDHIFINQGTIPQPIKEKYRFEGAELISTSHEEMVKIKKLGINILEANLVDIKKEYVRHDAEKISKMIMENVLESKFSQKGNKLFKLFNLKWDKSKN